MKILSPVASGSGAFVIHKMLESQVSNYQVVPYNPYLTLFPPSLYFVGMLRKTDIVHTTPDYAIYHYRKKVPMILTFHGYVLDKYMRKYSSTLQSFHYQTDLLYNTRKALPLAKIITAVSNFTADIVVKEMDPEVKIRVIHNGIDESVFIPGIDKNRYLDKNIKVLIGGHISAKKGSHWISGILENLEDNISIYYTTGMASSRKYPPHPRLISLGSIPHHEMPSVYPQFDILLFPSVREGFGLVVAEAMSCGLPVVATDCSSLPELVVDGKGGYLCGLGDEKEFAEKINLLAENTGLRKVMGEFNRSRVEDKFSARRMIKEYEQVFEEALS
jgi:glycosyltransferase involved in cell wall biosynthesis